MGRAALHESINGEYANTGIRSYIFELGHFRTNVMGANLQWDQSGFRSDLDDLRNMCINYAKGFNNTQSGDPKKGVDIMIDLVKGEGAFKGKEVPERLPLGKDAVDIIRLKCEKTLKILNEWEGVSSSTDFD